MNNFSGVNMAYIIVGLVLVGSALAARRIPIGQGLKMALAWVGIFAAAYVLFLFRGEGQEIWRRIVADVSGTSGVQQGAAMRIAKGDDGHFHVTAAVNGHRVDFLVDSGATITTISPESARAANVESDGGPPVPVITANGTAMSQPAIAAKFSVGVIERTDEKLHISEMTDADNLLGMSFLSSLKSWRVEGNTLILQP
jgi:aspartyl protease family protein